MRKHTYIDQQTQDTVRSGAISYIAADLGENVTLEEYARATRERTKRYTSALRRIAGRVGPTSTETTAGGW